MCQICNKPHADALHRYKTAPEETNDKAIDTTDGTAKAVSNCVNVCANDCGTTSSLIVPVWLHHKDQPEKQVQVYAVLDDQSDTCFITNEVRDELGLQGIELTLELGTMHAVESVSTQNIEGLVVSRNDKLVEIILLKIYTRGQIPVRRDQIPRPEFAQGWKHLRPIANKIPSYREDLTVGILIGNNCVQAIKPRDIVPGKPKDPYAIRTALGWGLIGAKIESNESSSTFKFAHPTQHKEVMSCSTIKKMFERDFSETGIQGKSTSHEDRRFLKEMKESIHLTDNGHYEMPLPLRDPAIEFPCNKKLAENRLNLLKRRFDKDPKYKDDYVVFMNEVIKNGYATLKNIRRPLTRRGILSTVSSIDDPLGLVAPFLLRGKRILQLLYKEGLDWDEPIPDDLRSEWEMWRSKLPLLEQMKIQRCFELHDFKDRKTVELHHFADASTEIYGQCSYLRLVDTSDRVHFSLVFGKARVAHLKPVTIPRLELTAALVSARVSETLTRELEYDTIDEIFWTDSQVVLGYIKSDARRFHTYVANRVQEIRDRTSPDQWLYVEGKSNPADDASRGLSARSLIESLRWINGPAFLWQTQKNWQDFGSHDESPIPSPDDKELKKVSSLATVAKEPPVLLQRLEYFSDWFRARQALVICIKYVRILRERVKDKKAIKTRSRVLITTKYEPLKVEELKNAEQRIIKAVQREEFGDEIRILGSFRVKREDQCEEATQEVKEIAKTSSLHRLDPFLDENGMLRVGGRIKQATSIAEEVKHPVVLPRRGHVSQLVVKHCHEKTEHQGKGFTLNEIRSSGYWIIGGGGAVTELVHNCEGRTQRIEKIWRAFLPAWRQELSILK
ncbi:hypothetical protein QZH41_013096 [Actinostola sp. cb2023]|nr:hypothetical protein QZH41_013096 [Actinostola sp. cb2023]